MTHYSPRILELLSSRLCHDLISPVGAISNGVELIEEMGLVEGADAVDLIADSAKKANIYLRLYRWAYGASGASSDVKPDDIKELFRNYMSLGKAQFEWEDSPHLKTIMPPRGLLKCLLNVMFMASDGLAIKGHMHVRVVNSDPFTFEVICKAERFTFKENMLKATFEEFDDEDLDPKTVHGKVTKLICEQYGVLISYDQSDDQTITFRVQGPE